MLVKEGLVAVKENVSPQSMKEEKNERKYGWNERMVAKARICVYIMVFLLHVKSEERMKENSSKKKEK